MFNSTKNCLLLTRWCPIFNNSFSDNRKNATYQSLRLGFCVKKKVWLVSDTENRTHTRLLLLMFVKIKAEGNCGIGGGPQVGALIVCLKPTPPSETGFGSVSLLLVEKCSRTKCVQDGLPFFLFSFKQSKTNIQCLQSARWLSLLMELLLLEKSAFSVGALLSQEPPGRAPARTLPCISRARQSQGMNPADSRIFALCHIWRERKDEWTVFDWRRWWRPSWSSLEGPFWKKRWWGSAQRLSLAKLASGPWAARTGMLHLCGFCLCDSAVSFLNGAWEVGSSCSAEWCGLGWARGTGVLVEKVTQRSSWFGCWTIVLWTFDNCGKSRAK